MAANQRHYVVGDIHGCFQEFLKLEEKILADASAHQAQAIIISCGDLIDRGPHSKDVIEYFRKRSSDGTHLFVLGNHEVIMLEVLEAIRPDLFDRVSLPTWFCPLSTRFEQEKHLLPSSDYQLYLNEHKESWLQQGGKETLESFNVDPLDPKSWNLVKETMKFLILSPLVLEFESFLVTHALPTKEHLEWIQSDDTQKQYKAANTLLWNRSLKHCKPQSKRWVSGHTPCKGIRRHRRKRVLQIDTGCYKGGALTAWNAEEDRFFKVKAIKTPSLSL